MPWLEGYTLRGRGAQQLRQQQRQIQQELLPLDLTIAAPALAQTPPAAAPTVLSSRPKKRMTVDAVKYKRLDVRMKFTAPLSFGV